jgi:hypothetical protein
MKASIFTQKDFLKACDLINQASDNFGIWFDTQDQNSFNHFFSGDYDKKEAKETLYKLIGLNFYGYNVYDTNYPYGI